MQMESRILSTALSTGHTGPLGSCSSTNHLPSGPAAFLLHSTSPSAHGGDARAHTFAPYKLQHWKPLHLHAQHAHHAYSERYSSHSEPWWTDFTRILSSRSQKGSGVHATNAYSWRQRFASRERSVAGSRNPQGGAAATPVFKPPYSCMSVASQDSSQTVRSKGTASNNSVQSSMSAFGSLERLLASLSCFVAFCCMHVEGKVIEPEVVMLYYVTLLALVALSCTVVLQPPTFVDTYQSLEFIMLLALCDLVYVSLGTSRWRSPVLTHGVHVVHD